MAAILTYHANVNAQSSSGCTALGLAAEAGRLDAVTMLLEHKANLERADFSGANLRRATFFASQLRDSVFTGADITGADFRDATGLEHAAGLHHAGGFSSARWAGIPAG